jgi:hypothetical protein
MGSMLRIWQISTVLAWALVIALGGPSPAQTTPAPGSAAPEEKPAAKTEPAQAGGLATEQQQVAERFRELEKLLLRMAELTAPTDPRRAALLRQAVAQSKDRDLDHQFEQLVELLRQERLSLVVKNQGEVQQDLVKLLELLLSEDRTKRIESEKARIREYLKRVNKLIKEQRGIQGETARQGDARKLADRQRELSDKTAELAGDIRENEGQKPADHGVKEGQPGDGNKKDDSDPKKSDQPDNKKPDNKKPDDEKPDNGDNRKKEDGRPGGADKKDQGGKGEKGDKKDNSQPGGEQKPAQPGEKADGEAEQSSPQSGEQQPPQDSPAQKRLQQAQKRMKEAQQKLEQAKRDEATEQQAEALKELEQAKADLEEILRQLREEEASRTLAMLEGRFRKMLDAQVEIYEGTKRLDKVPQTQRDHDDEIEAGRLSRKESQIAGEADKALAVLREEGTAVAFPEAVTEMRDDMRQVVDRLAQAKVGEVTQGIEKDIIVALEEMIASLQKAQKDKDSKNTPGQPAPDEDSDPPLVDTLSELKMIRALQMRVNLRTQRYAEMTKTEQTETPELLEALKRLAEREQRIHQVTRDIAVGRNQ